MQKVRRLEDSDDFPDEDRPNFLGQLAPGANLPVFKLNPSSGFSSADDTGVDPRDCAREAYMIAKAMLEEREKHGNEE